MGGRACGGLHQRCTWWQPSLPKRIHYLQRVTSRSNAAFPAGNTITQTRFMSAASAATPVTITAEKLWPRILEVYDSAISSGAISKTDTNEEFYWDSVLDVEYVVRVATILKDKPVAPSLATRSESPGNPPSTPRPPPAPAPAWRNPFLPYEPALWVCELSPSHRLLLNKFNVVPHHLLVVTSAFESQQDPLNAADLEATWQVLGVMPGGGLAFFNCGEHSGRSQPHKHLQVVPLPFSQGGRGGGSPVAPVAGVITRAAQRAAAKTMQVFEVRAFPLRYYAALLKDDSSPDELEAVFQALLARACEGSELAMSLATAADSTDPPAAAGGPAVAAAAAGGGPAVSYNVLMTRSFMALVPRCRERSGPCALNSLPFAGTVLVRSSAELDYVRETGPTTMLSHVGLPWPVAARH